MFCDKLWLVTDSVRSPDQGILLARYFSETGNLAKSIKLAYDRQSFTFFNSTHQVFHIFPHHVTRDFPACYNTVSFSWTCVTHPDFSSSCRPHLMCLDLLSGMASPAYLCLLSKPSCPSPALPAPRLPGGPELRRREQSSVCEPLRCFHQQRNDWLTPSETSRGSARSSFWTSCIVQYAVCENRKKTTTTHF